jgi:hypothetical protein
MNNIIFNFAIMIGAGCLGIGFHVMEKISALRKKHIDARPEQILRIYLFEDWNTIIVSFMFLLMSVALMYFKIHALLKIPDQWSDLFYFCFFLVGGYGGQRIVYKYLGTAESKLSQGADKLNK